MNTRILALIIFLLGSLTQTVQAQVFESGNATYDSGSGLLEVNVTWSGFDTLVGGVATLSFDTDAATNPFTFGVTALDSFSPDSGSLISTSNGISSQALIVEITPTITAAGSFSFSAIFSGVTDDVIGEPLDLGGNWNGDFSGLPGFISFQDLDIVTVQAGSVNPPAPPAATAVPAFGLLGSAFLSLLVIAAAFIRNRKTFS